MKRCPPAAGAGEGACPAGGNGDQAARLSRGWRGAGPGALDFAAVVGVAHARGIPVIVDAASTLPPVDHLRRWTRGGADLVVFSGGKGLRAPQDTGLLAGRTDLARRSHRLRIVDDWSWLVGGGQGIMVDPES